MNDSAAASSKSSSEPSASKTALSEADVFKLIVESSFDLIVVLDGSKRFRYVNSRHEETLGYASAEMVGRPVR